MLRRVLRTPPISARAVTIPARKTAPGERAGGPGFAPAGEGAAPEAGDRSERPDDAERAGPAGPSDEASADETGDDVLVGTEDGAPARADSGAADDGADAAPGAASARLSPLAVEKEIETRLAEFEGRYQREREDAYKAGFQDGRAEGLKEGKAQSAGEAALLSASVDSLSKQWEGLAHGHDARLAELAVAVARKIVGAVASIDPAPVLQAVQDCLGYLSDRSRVVVRVNPEDLDVVRKHRDKWLESLESLEHLVIEADETIARGGCVLESVVGDVDAQVEERLERMRAALVEAVAT